MAARAQRRALTTPATAATAVPSTATHPRAPANVRPAMDSTLRFACRVTLGLTHAPGCASLTTTLAPSESVGPPRWSTSRVVHLCNPQLISPRTVRLSRWSLYAGDSGYSSCGSSGHCCKSGSEICFNPPGEGSSSDYCCASRKPSFCGRAVSTLNTRALSRTTSTQHRSAHFLRHAGFMLRSLTYLVCRPR